MTDENLDLAELPLEATADRLASPAVASIAPWWHTLLVIAMLLTWGMLTRGTTYSYASRPHWQTYLSMSMMQFVVLGAIVSGIYHRRAFFISTLIRSARNWWLEVVRGICIYFIGLVLSVIVVAVVHATGHHMGAKPNVFLEIAPSSWNDLLLWGMTSMCIGFCEEHQMRGYLLQQLLGWGGALRIKPSLATALAVGVSSVLFGSLHLYEGMSGAVTIGLLGALYAVAVLRFGNLRAVIVAHAVQDFIALLLMAMRLHTLG